MKSPSWVARSCRAQQFPRGRQIRHVNAGLDQQAKILQGEIAAEALLARVKSRRQLAVGRQRRAGVAEEEMSVRDVDLVHQVARLARGGPLAERQRLRRAAGIEVELGHVGVKAGKLRIEEPSRRVVGAALLVAVLQDQDRAALDEGPSLRRESLVGIREDLNRRIE